MRILTCTRRTSHYTKLVLFFRICSFVKYLFPSATHPCVGSQAPATPGMRSVWLNWLWTWGEVVMPPSSLFPSPQRLPPMGFYPV